MCFNITCPSAARSLLKQGVTDFLVLEAKARVGGRSHATDVPTASGMMIPSFLTHLMR
jgi:monoamine oxidase